MKNNIMPPLVLTIICVIVCALLAFAYNATYVDNTGVLTEDMKKGCTEIFGEADYQIKLEPDAETKTPVTYDVEGINSVITAEGTDNCIIELTQDGYSKGGLHLLIGIDKDGAIQGIYFLSIGETPGLGTKVQNEDFVGKFKGYTIDTDETAIDNVTAATYSSKGMKAACKKAVELYNEHKEEIFNG